MRRMTRMASLAALVLLLALLAPRLAMAHANEDHGAASAQSESPASAPHAPRTAAVGARRAGNAAASCGSAFCMVNTNWNAQGAWIEPGARLDLRYEYIDQDQPRAGRRAVGVGEIPQHHDEIRTINRNWLGTFDYTFNDKWGVSATLPFGGRDHSHIHHHGGQDLMETW